MIFLWVTFCIGKDESYKLENENWLKSNAKRSGVHSLPSGLQYKVKSYGQGRESPTLDDIVGLHYTVKLIDGRQIDSSYSRGHAAKFRILHYYIPGVKEIMKLMKVGDRWEVYIPPHLGWGPRELERVPAYSVLIYDMTLVEIQGKEILERKHEKDEL